MTPPARRIRGPTDPIRVAIADDSGLIYSDDYREGWLWGFKSLGCELRVVDISPLRRRISHNSAYRSIAPRGFAKMAAQTVTNWRADLLFCHHGRAASNDAALLEYVKRRGVTTAVYLCDEPYESGETTRYSPAFDVVFSMDPCTVEAHETARGGRGKVFYLPPAAHTGKFKVNRFDRNGKAFFLGNAELPPRPEFFGLVEQAVDADIRFWPSREGRPVGKGHPKWVPVECHPEAYSACAVGLNVHRDPRITKECWQRRVRNRSRNMQIPAGLELCHEPSGFGTGFWNDFDLPAAHVNPRFFEMAACGTLVVSDDHRAELPRMFPYAPRAGDPDHYLELVRYYLNNVDEAEEIGLRCATEISRRHSWKHRAAEVLIRAGFRDVGAADLRSCLGEPAGWLTPQLSDGLKDIWSSDRTGLSGQRWSPAYGLALTKQSGTRSDTGSIDVIL